MQNIDQECLDAFERLALAGNKPPLEEFVRQHGVQSAATVQELVCLDLEFSWKQAMSSGSGGLRLEDYASRLPQLGAMGRFPLELIAEEYRVRRRFGTATGHESFLRRFPGRSAEIRAACANVDEALRIEQSRGPRLGPSPVREAVRAGESYQEYVLEAMVGAGGLAKVYRGRRKRDGEVVAIKFLRKRFAAEPAVVEQFWREYSLAKQLVHAGLVRPRGLGATPWGGVFLVLDYVEGEDLAKIVAGERPDWRTASRWVQQAAEALSAAHAQGVVHCDLKPANLLRDRSGAIRVTDFGFARHLDECGGATEALAGTAAYMAPEQVADCFGPIGQQTDVYGLGAVLFELLTGRPPHTGATIGDVLAGVVRPVPVPSVRTQSAELPESIAAVCRRALAKSPTARYPDMPALRHALDVALTSPTQAADDA